jgi:hypothetical protein
VWRDPNLLAAPSAGLLSSMGMLGGPGLHHHHHHAAAAAHHHGLLIAAGGGGLSPSGLDGGHTSPLLGHAPPSSTTPLPPSDISQQSSDSESAVAKGRVSQCYSRRILVLNFLKVDCSHS